MLRPKINQQLPLEEITLAAALKPAGYVSAHIGKWHLGGKGFEPEKRVFLREQLTEPVVRDVQRRCGREHECQRSDDAVRRHPATQRHAGLPKSPSGRTASTSATSTNVKMIE